MKILVYGINYYPELVGIGKYSAEMCEWLAEQGHRIEVITAMPFYPYWKIPESYRKKWWHTEKINKVNVHRCPLYVPSTVTGKSRIIHEMSFALSSLVYWLRCLFTKYDVVICIAPPLQVGLAGVIYKIFHKTLFIYHIQDLQLDAAKQLGLIKNKIFLNFISKFEKFLFNQSHYISTISEGMNRNISLKGISSEKIIDLNNWIDTQQMVPEQPQPQIRELFKIDASKKIVLYSGNIGEKQGLDIIIDVAKLLKDTNIFFLIIGEGAYKKKLEELIHLHKLANVKIFPLQSSEIFCKILNMADIHLVLQKKAAADLVMPSKLTSILSVGGAAIVTTEKGTTLYDIITKNKISIIVEPENPIALRGAITECIKSDLSEYKKNARYYAQTILEKTIIMKKFQDFLEKNIKREQ